MVRWGGGLLCISSDRYDRMRAKIKTQKNPKSNFRTVKISSKTKQVWLYFVHRTARTGYAVSLIPRIFEHPKKSLLKSGHPKKYLPNFPAQKNPGISSNQDIRRTNELIDYLTKRDHDKTFLVELTHSKTNLRQSLHTIQHYLTICAAFTSTPSF